MKEKCKTFALCPDELAVAATKCEMKDMACQTKLEDTV
jgi:hypothetical protein